MTEVDEDAPQGSDPWYQQHVGIISSSLCPRICCIDSHNRALDLWHVMAILGSCPFEKSDALPIQAGHYNEGPIADRALPMIARLEKLNPQRVRVRNPRMFKHAYISWLGASADRLVQLQGKSGEWQDILPHLIIECKFKMNGLIMMEPDITHLLQITHQMAVFGARMRHCYLVYGCRNNAQSDSDYVNGPLCITIFRVPFSPRLWIWMLEQLVEFHDAVLSKKPLDWLTDEDIARRNYTPTKRPQLLAMEVQRYWKIKWHSGPNQRAQLEDLMLSIKQSYRGLDWKRIRGWLPPAPHWERIEEEEEILESSSSESEDTPHV